MIHELKLQPTPFDAIKSGIKGIECRLFDEKRQQIQLGDTLIFKRNPELQETISAEVVGLLRYPTFSALFADFPPQIFGGESMEALEKLIYSFYSKEDEVKYGVLGIRIRLNNG
jgi:ASC-1-like (ASCH) protein